jgi:hypothetical protein
VQSPVIAAQPRQCFNTGNTPGGGIDEGLENSKRLSIEHGRLP